eukprot:7541002-Pyramimonas_sp.AAC.2
MSTSFRGMAHQRCPVALQARARCFSRSTPLSSKVAVNSQPRHPSRAVLRCKAKDDDDDDDVE